MLPLIQCRTPAKPCSYSASKRRGAVAELGQFLDAAVSHRLVELAIEVEEQAASEEAPSRAAENCPQRGPSMGESGRGGYPNR